jgi:hypothetical protein
MPKKRRLNPQSVWEEEQLAHAFREAGVKDVHVGRLYRRARERSPPAPPCTCPHSAPRHRSRPGRRARHLLRNPDAGWADVPALPKAAVAVLDQHFVRSTSALEACQRSSDGTTAKLLVRLQDGLQVEAVIMTYSHPGAPASPGPPLGARQCCVAGPSLRACRPAWASWRRLKVRVLAPCTAQDPLCAVKDSAAVYNKGETQGAAAPR